MKRALVAAAVVVALLVSAALYHALHRAPRRAVAQLKRAIATDDVRALREVVDVAAVRRGIVAQILASAAASPQGDQVKEGDGAKLAETLAGGFADQIVEELFTPAGLARATAGKAGKPLGDAALHLRGPSRFVVDTADAEGVVMRLILTRDGLAWRVTDVEVPPRKQGAPAVPVRDPCKDLQRHASSDLKGLLIAEEAHRAANDRYSTNLAEIGFVQRSDAASYDIRVIEAGERTFRATAVGKGDMAGDELVIDQTNRVTKTRDRCGP